MSLYNEPARFDPEVESRAITFENPTGARGAGGKTFGGRKGNPNKTVQPGEKVVLADIEGPGQIRHIWMTFRHMAPGEMRGIWMEVYYDGMKEPSVSLPVLDFFGLPLGRPSHVVTAMTAVQQGRGYNAYFPMPFAKNIRVEFTNGSGEVLHFYYQIDYTLEKKLAKNTGYLHVSFRRENPTTLKQDFVIADGFEGPGRFLGCAIGIRIIHNHQGWYGEGEVKVYLDGDKDYPTICGTGLEDYVGTAWGMEGHTANYAGVPAWVVDDPTAERPQPDLVSFYRWHVTDPILFKRDVKVTIQQIGAMGILPGQEHLMDEYEPAGRGWIRPKDMPGMEHIPVAAFGLAERVDDYSAAAFVYCKKPQAVPRLDVAAAVADLARMPYEPLSRFEKQMQGINEGSPFEPTKKELQDMEKRIKRSRDYEAAKKKK